MPPKSLSEMKPKSRFFAGFILNKLWTDRYWCGEGQRQHLGHTSLDNVPKGRPRSEKGEILEVADDLHSLGFICYISATRDTHVCASRSQEIIIKALPTVNEYRTQVCLPPLTLQDIK
jgi:hypothetical protein